MKGVKKEFFWQDQSGRGETNTFSLSEIKKAMVGQKNYNNESCYIWADFAEIGSTWENAANKITRTK